MKNNIFRAASLMLLITLFASCTAVWDHSSDCPDVEPRDLELYGTQSHWLKVADTSWDANDAIGVYALKTNTALADANIYNSYSNVAYQTTAGDGKFTASGSQSITLKADQKVDLIAYYPYSANITADYKYNFDTSDQSKQKSFDLLYSNNVKERDNLNNTATMSFSHKLTKVTLVLDLQGATPTTVEMGIDGVAIRGSMNLVDGTVTTGTTTANVLNTAVKSTTGKYASLLILPPQALEGKVIRVKFGGKDYVATLNNELTTQSGFEYRINLKYQEVAGTAGLRIESTNIVDWNDGGEVDAGTVTEEGGSTPPATIEVVSVTLAPTTAELEVSKSITLTATVAPDNATDKSLTWTSNKPEVAEVADGVVTGKSAGEAVITATSNNGKNATATITVKPKVASPSIPNVPGENL